MTTHELNCPQCGQFDKVQKVSALYTSGVSTVEYETWKPPPPKSDLWPILEKRKGVGQTRLSARLAPPEKPGPKGVWSWVLGIEVLLAMLACASLSILFGEAFALFVLVGVAVLVGGIVVHSNQQKEADARMPQWNEAMRRWDQLYYCARCDGIFIPDETPLIPTGRMSEFLFAAPTKPPKFFEEVKEEVEEPDYKECPRCAEMIRGRAKACRFCGYEFSTEELEEERKRAGREAQRAERERVEREKAENERLEAEYRMWHSPERIRQWGQTVVKCPHCSTLNTTNVSSCRRCSADLSSVPTVRNPYL